jgi:Peptidase A4 family
MLRRAAATAVVHPCLVSGIDEREVAMRKLFLSGALALFGLAAPTAPGPDPRRLLTGWRRHGVGCSPWGGVMGPAVPGLYNVPIIGKVTLPGALGPVLGSGKGNSNGLWHATAVQSSNWAGYADTNDTFNSVSSSSWTEPTVNCANTNSSLDGLLSLSNLLGGPGAASAFWVGLDGYNSTSVEQLGTDSG